MRVIVQPARLPSLGRGPARLRGAGAAAGAQMGLSSWFTFAKRVSQPIDPAAVSFLTMTPRPTLASRLWQWLGSKKFLGALGQGGLPTLVAEVILVVATLSLFQLLIRFVRQVLVIVKEIKRRDESEEPPAAGGDGHGPTGRALSAPPRGLPALPLLGLVVSIVGASALDSFAASGIASRAGLKAYVRWIVGLRLGCDLLLELALAAVALHLLDVLRSRIVSEETAALGQKIMGGSSPQRPRTLDRRASINEARLNTLVQSLSAAVWVCTVLALLDTVGVKFQVRRDAARRPHRRGAAPQPEPARAL